MNRTSEYARNAYMKELEEFNEKMLVPIFLELLAERTSSIADEVRIGTE